MYQIFPYRCIRDLCSDSVIENGCEKKLSFPFSPFFIIYFFHIVLSLFFKKDEILSFLTDKKKSKNIQSVFLASTRGKIYSGVLDLSEGKGDITKKTLKENEKVN